jgi:hypothetical protein
VEPSNAYLLEDSMTRTLQLYQSSLRHGNLTGSPGTEVSP